MKLKINTKFSIKTLTLSTLLVNCIMTFTLLAGCTKDAGEGGTSAIMGKVLVHNYNAEFTNKLEEYYSQDEDVYIVYGDNEVYNDKFSTHYDGTYKFEHLREGKYTVYSYSKDTTGSQALIPVVKEVEITDKDQIVNVEDIIIIN